MGNSNRFLLYVLELEHTRRVNSLQNIISKEENSNLRKKT